MNSYCNERISQNFITAKKKINSFQKTITKDWNIRATDGLFWNATVPYYRFSSPSH